MNLYYLSDLLERHIYCSPVQQVTFSFLIAAGCTLAGDVAITSYSKAIRPSLGTRWIWRVLSFGVLYFGVFQLLSNSGYRFSGTIGRCF